MKITIIAAISQNHVIGQNDDLVWSLPADLRQYHEKVTGKWVMMGRKTWETDFGILPTQQTIVITRQKDYQDDKVLVENSINAAIEVAKNNDIQELIILGGGEIYRQSMEIANELIITEVQVRVGGDTFFPFINPLVWEETERTPYSKDAENEYDFDVVKYERI